MPDNKDIYEKVVHTIMKTLKLSGVCCVLALVVLACCVKQPEITEKESETEFKEEVESIKEKEIESKKTEESFEFLRGEIITKDIFIPSRSTGTPSGKLAVRLQIPKKENIRYPEGAPIVIIGEGGNAADGIINKKMPHLDDMIVITFIYPGGENLEQDRHSDGVYDYRGKKSIEALKDVILYAAGEIKDSKGKLIDDLMDFNVLHNNIGFIGFSFGGNIGVAVAALHKEVAPHLKYVIQWETPVSSQIATRDLGRMLFQPLEKGESGRSDYFNPRYIGYGPLIIDVDYSDIQFDPESVYPVFLDGNKDGRYTVRMGSHYRYPTPDLNDNNILELNEDWGLDTYPYDTYDTDGKQVYSRPVTYALQRYNAFSGGWPDRIATVEEADAYWDIRESVQLYEKALKNIPELEGMFLLSINDHVQSDPYKSHAHQAFDGWTAHGTWVKINCDPRYIFEVDPSLNDRNIFIPNTGPNTAPVWEDLRSYCIPEEVKDEVYQIAAVHEMADRVKERSRRYSNLFLVLPLLIVNFHHLKIRFLIL